MKTSRTIRGFTLVELMIALVLGLILSGAALSAFVANKRVYAASESLGRVQENARAAFELMSRDAREAAGNACNSKNQPVNVLNKDKPGGLPAYADFMGGLSGTDGIDGTSQRDTVVFKSATDTGAAVDSDNSTNVNILTLTNVPDIQEDDIVVVCDPERATIFQVTKANGNDFKIQTNKSKVPGNATNCMLGDVNGDGKDNDCGNGSVKRYAYGCQGGEWKGGSGCINGPAPAFFSKLRSVSWYIGAGSKGGTSLFRRIDGPKAAGDEIAEGVTGMALTYLVDSDQYLTADQVTAADAWTQVRAVRIDLEFEGEDRGAVSDVAGSPQGIKRRVAHVVALRNRING